MGSICISIKASEPQQELLIAQLSEVGAEGFEQTASNLLAYFNPIQLPAYDVQQLLQGFEFQTIEIADQNWNELWESNFPPVLVENFCAVRADFHPAVTGVEHEILLMPKMSFGTGHHATTHMMIREMKDIDFAGRSVFDFGTGTGILAILAEKMGAAHIVAIDNDNWSIENAHENMQRNGCSSIEISLASEIPDGKFDIILANINRNVILHHLPQLKKTLKYPGVLLLSGLLLSDEDDIMSACRDQGLQFAGRREYNSWIALKWEQDNI